MRLRIRLSEILFENQNTTAAVTMEMKYLHTGLSNYAEIPLLHRLVIS